jgi:hypothetical protein
MRTFPILLSHTTDSIRNIYYILYDIQSRS